MEESSAFRHDLLNWGRKGGEVIPSCIGQAIGAGEEDRLLWIWDKHCDSLAENADREGHTRSTRESSSEAHLKWLVLPALGYILGLIAKWCLLILKDESHLL